jgi:hypothetical protein
MRRRALALLLGSVLAAMLFGSTDALGAPAAPDYQLEFKDHGYTIAAGGSVATVFLSVSRGNLFAGQGAQTEYIARGVVGGGLRATLGDVGRIALRFRPTGPWRAIRRCWKGDPRVERPGVFVGGLHFVGEHRYLTIDRSRVAGVEQRSSRHCTPAGGADRVSRRAGLAVRPRLGLPSTELSPASRQPRTRLFADFRAGPQARAFQVTEQKSGGLHLLAIEQDVVDRLGTYRLADAIAPRGHFEADRSLSSASVTGAARFSGSASLSRAADGTRTWTGDLTASFLGYPDAPLTGPLFKTGLSRGF